MKNLVLIGILLFAIAINAQSKQVKPLFETSGHLVKVTYYHDNGKIAQMGFYKNNALHGEWRSYDNQGNKIAIAMYNEGKKTGKWFFWNGGKLNEVDYLNNRIVNVTRWNNANSMVVN